MGVMNRRGRTLVVFGVSLLAVAGCQGDEGEGDDGAATTVAVTAAPPPTASPTPPTTVASSAMATTTVSSTSPPTGPADTTLASTSPADIEAAKAAVIAAAVEAKEAWWAIRQNPADPAAHERVRLAYAEEGETFVLAHAAEMLLAGERTVRSDELEALFVVFSDEVAVDLSTGKASVRACENNSWVLVVDDGSEQSGILDDSVWTYVETFELAFVDSSWQAIGSVVESQLEGFQSCDGL